MKPSILFAAAALVLVIAPVQASIVSNSGFESGSGSTIDNWTSNGWSIAGNAYTGAKSVVTACQGVSCLNAATGAYLYQDLATTAGSNYTLTFYFNPGNLAGAQLNVLWNGSVVDTITTGTLNAYQEYTVSNLTAASGTTRLQFNGRDDPATLYLDEVNVNPADVGAGATPEPASIVLGATGLAALAVVQRFRTRRSS